jgi:hypothetical protein
MSEHLRLLICHTCRSIEEVPNFTGPPEHDVLLDHVLEAHRFADGREHIGKLALVATKDWEDINRRQAIEAQIKAAVEKSTGLPSEFYATRNTYQADALRCYSKHQRPKEGCIDYCDSSKRLGNPTKAGWEAGPRVFLCQFCPVETWVRTQVREQKGAYK